MCYSLQPTRTGLDHLRQRQERQWEWVESQAKATKVSSIHRESWEYSQEVFIFLSERVSQRPLLRTAVLQSAVWLVEFEVCFQVRLSCPVVAIA